MTLELLIASVIITIIPIGGTLPNTEDICGDEVGGVYTEDKIYLCAGEDIKFRRQHEIGHPIYEEYLTEGQRKEYEKIYKKHHKIGIRAFEREYGYSDVEESFCEDYATWKTGEKANIYTKKRIQLIKTFLEKK